MAQTDTIAGEVDPRPAPAECQHLTGYWINQPAGSFRCYSCGCQFNLVDLPEAARKIERWQAS